MEWDPTLLFTTQPHPASNTNTMASESTLLYDDTWHQPSTITCHCCLEYITANSAHVLGAAVVYFDATHPFLSYVVEIKQ
jgi:hypothetical protein